LTTIAVEGAAFRSDVLMSADWIMLYR